MSEHDQLVRLNERLSSFKDWLTTLYYKSDVDEYTVWEELTNDTVKKIEDKFKELFPDGEVKR